MNVIKNRNKFSLISAILFLVFGIVNVIILGSFFGQNWFVVVYYSLMIILSLALSYFSFFEKKKNLFIALLVFPALEISYMIHFHISVEIIIHIICILLLSVIIQLNMKNNPLIKTMWYIPGALIILWCIIDCFRIGYIPYYLCAKDLTLGSALLFYGLWLSKTTIVPSTVYQNNISQDSSNYALGTADKLKSLKEMLDQGLITQEDFDAKKKQLLGL